MSPAAPPLWSRDGRLRPATPAARVEARAASAAPLSISCTPPSTGATPPDGRGWRRGAGPVWVGSSRRRCRSSGRTGRSLAVDDHLIL